LGLSVILFLNHSSSATKESAELAREEESSDKPPWWFHFGFLTHVPLAPLLALPGLPLSPIVGPPRASIRAFASWNACHGTLVGVSCLDLLQLGLFQSP
jgi:hypothetical protein